MRNETERVRGWVGSMYVAGSLFYIGGHEHHCRFLNRTDSEGWGVDLCGEDTTQGNREQLSHNDMTVMGLHRAIVELEFSYVH